MNRGDRGDLAVGHGDRLSGSTGSADTPAYIVAAF